MANASHARLSARLSSLLLLAAAAAAADAPLPHSPPFASPQNLLSLQKQAHISKNKEVPLFLNGNATHAREGDACCNCAVVRHGGRAEQTPNGTARRKRNNYSSNEIRVAARFQFQMEKIRIYRIAKQ
jgi:hypothetical protein